ncbi:MAG: helix-hairpin-helix domain-containing protein, partial [Pseudomonadota bacterium]|nr:helix-hairpin-helix domain-containing protein [Pseudomonadota bacterium]
SKEMEVVVPDHQLSLAIGKRGQNVKLAARLTGWKIDILAESAASQRTSESIFNIMLIPGMTETMAQNIFQSGFGSFQIIADANVEDIMTIPGYDAPEKAQKLIDESKQIYVKYEAEGGVPKAPVKIETKVDMGSHAKANADEMLKAEMAKLKAEETVAMAETQTTEEKGGN